MIDELVADIDAAVGNLCRAFSKHGLEEPTAVAPRSGHTFRMLKQSGEVAVYCRGEQLRDDVACNIDGMLLLRTQS